MILAPHCLYHVCLAVALNNLWFIWLLVFSIFAELFTASSGRVGQGRLTDGGLVGRADQPTKGWSALWLARPGFGRVGQFIGWPCSLVLGSGPLFRS